MKKLALMATVATLMLAFTTVAVTAQEKAKAEKAKPAPAQAPLSYKASPENYKLLAENEQFRVILHTAKPGQRDAWHSHSALVNYQLSENCTSRIHLPDGKYTDRSRKRGDVTFQAAVASHSFENTGKTVCEGLIVERK